MPAVRLSALYFALFAVPGALLPFLPPFLLARGLDAAELGLLLGLITVIRIGAPGVWGELADRTGARATIVRVGLAGSVVALAGLMVTEDILWIGVALTIHGLFNAAVLPQVESITLSALGEQAARYARIRLWGSVGFIGAVLLAGWLTETRGIDTLAPLVVVLQLATWGTSLWIPRTLRSSSTREDDLRMRGACGRAVFVFLMVALLMAASHGPYYAFFSIRLETLGMGGTVIGILWAFAVVAEVGLFVVTPRLVTAYTGRTLFTVCMALTGLRWLLIGYGAESLVVLVLAQALHAVSFGLFHAAAIHYVRSAFPPHRQGRGQSLYSALGFGLGSAIGSAAGGYLWLNTSPQMTFTVAAGVCVVGAVLAWRGVVDMPSQQPSGGPSRDV